MARRGGWPTDREVRQQRVQAERYARAQRSYTGFKHTGEGMARAMAAKASMFKSPAESAHHPDRPGMAEAHEAARIHRSMKMEQRNVAAGGKSAFSVQELRAARDQMASQARALQVGTRGGQFYIGPSGERVYTKK